MAYRKAESWQINVNNFLMSNTNWFSTVNAFNFRYGTRPEQDNKSQDIVRRNANFSVVRPTANIYKFQQIYHQPLPILTKTSKTVGILASEYPLMTRRVLVFHVPCKQSRRHNVRIRNRILAVLVMPKCPFPLGIFNFFVFSTKESKMFEIWIIWTWRDHVFVTWC